MSAPPPPPPEAAVACDNARDPHSNIGCFPGQTSPRPTCSNQTITTGEEVFQRYTYKEPIQYQIKYIYIIIYNIFRLLASRQEGGNILGYIIHVVVVIVFGEYIREYSVSVQFNFELEHFGINLKIILNHAWPAASCI